MREYSVSFHHPLLSLSDIRVCNIQFKPTGPDQQQQTRQPSQQAISLAVFVLFGSPKQTHLLSIGLLAPDLLISFMTENSTYAIYQESNHLIVFLISIHSATSSKSRELKLPSAQGK